MISYIFLYLINHSNYSSYLSHFICLNAFYLWILCYFDQRSILKDHIRAMGDEDEISNKKILELLLDLQKNLAQNTTCVKQIANNIEEIKQQQEDLKKEVLSLKTNTQASIRALEANQHEEEFEKCKSKQQNYEDRAKTAESKTVNLNAHLHSLQDTLKENCHKINDLEKYCRRCMVEISNIPVKPEESMKSIITALATDMNINNFSYDNDVDVAHRLHSKLFRRRILSCSITEQKGMSFMTSVKP